MFCPPINRERYEKEVESSDILNMSLKNTYCYKELRMHRKRKQRTAELFNAHILFYFSQLLMHIDTHKRIYI